MRIVVFLSIIRVTVLSSTWAQENNTEQKIGNQVSNGCNGIKLNTNVPFIGNCIVLRRSNEASTTTDPNTTEVTPITAFPILIGGLSKILLTAILVISFLLIVAGGVMMAMGGADSSKYDQGKQLIYKVAIGLALLGVSGIILRLANPNFFG